MSVLQIGEATKALQKYGDLTSERVLRVSRDKPQRKDYSSINAFQTGSSEEYLITKSYQGALVVEQEELPRNSTNESQWQSHRSGE